MTPEQATAFALNLPEATEDHPFGVTPDVYRVGGKIFALLMADPENPRLSLKCDPPLAQILREQYSAITPGYHLNKRHWNTIDLAGGVPDEEIEEMILHSYDRVVVKPRKTT